MDRFTPSILQRVEQGYAATQLFLRGQYQIFLNVSRRNYAMGKMIDCDSVEV
jgi:hypothetical protein